MHFVHRNRWGLSDQPYDWGRHPWVRRWLMRPICARKSLRHREQGMVTTEADLPVPFISFLRSSVAAFLLVSDFRSTFDNFTLLLSVLRQIFLAIRGNTERFHGDLQCVFEVLFLASLGPLTLRQFVVQQFLREEAIFHVDNMTGPTKLYLLQDGIDTGKRSQS